MSPISRWIIGIVALLCTVGFAAAGITALPQAFILAAFTCLIAVACLVRSARGWTVRLIGAIVCLAFVCYVVASWNKPDFRRAIVGMFVIGLPAGYVAIRGEYPEWGRLSEVFRKDDPSGPSAPR